MVTILDVNFLASPGTYERTFVRYATWGFRRSIRVADRLTTISEYSRTSIAQHLGADPALFSVVYPGLDEPPAVPSSAPPLDRPYALYVGATEVHKNVGILLEAWAAGSPGGLSLAIVGQPGRDHARLAAQAGRMGGRVRLVGRATDEELERWYRHATVFLFPSRMEGFGYPPLEAMQRGVPVVASTSGSLPEVLGDAAIYHDPDDATALRRSVEQLTEDPNERDRCVASGYGQAARYRWSGTATQMGHLLEAVSGR